MESEEMGENHIIVHVIEKMILLRFKKNNFTDTDNEIILFFNSYPKTHLCCHLCFPNAQTSLYPDWTVNSQEGSCQRSSSDTEAHGMLGKKDF